MVNIKVGAESSKTKMEPKITTQNEWLTPDDLFEEFGIAKSTQAKYRMNRKIPFSKIGSKYIKYNRTEINEWLHNHKIVTK